MPANFNSHAHVERDILRNFCTSVFSYFNSHAHVERDGGRGKAATAAIDFNSHAHVERDEYLKIDTKCPQISTHTLTWSVTLDVVYIWCLLNVMRTYFFI